MRLFNQRPPVAAGRCHITPPGAAKALPHRRRLYTPGRHAALWCRIADERDAAERKARACQIIDQLQQRFGDQLHERLALRRRRPVDHGGAAQAPISPPDKAGGSRPHAARSYQCGVLRFNRPAVPTTLWRRRRNRIGPRR
jgi:hypothetical protein